MRKVFIAIFAALPLVAGPAAAEQRPNSRGGLAGPASFDARDRSSDDIDGRNQQTSAPPAPDFGRIIRASHVRGNSAVRSGVVPSRSKSASTAVRSATATPMRAGVAAPAGVGGSRAVRSAALPIGANVGRDAYLPTVGGSRAMQVARATALFTNTDAMGQDYTKCRDAYFTCMDQFCGIKSDTYRRCLCSGQYREFRDREDAFEEAKQLIMEFNENNLYAIGLSAAEANAVYSATEGEKQIRKDNSASAKLLGNINDLLSGQAKASQKTAMSKVLSVDFDQMMDDIWNTDGDSPFAAGNQAKNLESKEGTELYNIVHRQCQNTSSDCKTAAVGNMAASAYSILIAQDCNTYEKKLDGQKTALESTLRDVNKMMREARLEDFRSHNSASVNECVGKVRNAMMDPSACGSGWVRCLDFSGRYLNQTTGEPIYTAQFFKLDSVINLNDLDGDPNNKIFLKELEKLKNRATEVLNTCRTEADIVWGEFKRQALIEIAQSQSEKIEEVKNSCIDKMKSCYDTQSGAMNKFSQLDGDKGLVQASAGALNQRAARAMCKENVLACAALHGDPDGCLVSDMTGKVTDAPGKTCGLGALIAFVDTVDTEKVAQRCKEGLLAYMYDLCTPTGGTNQQCDIPDANGYCSPEAMATYQAKQNPTMQYPYGCRHRPLQGQGSVSELLVQRAQVICVNPETGELDGQVTRAIEDTINDIAMRMRNVLGNECRDIKGKYAGRTAWRSEIDNGNVDGSGGQETIQVVADWAMLSYQGIEAFLKTIPSHIRVAYETLDEPKVANGMAAPLADNSTAAKLMKWEGPALRAQGWGTCTLMDAKFICERPANLTQMPIAKYNPDTFTCARTPDFSRVLCTKGMGGIWLDDQKGGLPGKVCRFNDK